MDIFKFRNPTDPLKMEQGFLLEDIEKKMWVERYCDAGEFTLEANVSSGLQELLPIGSFISHVESTEVMVVENHEINESHGEEAKITVSGRGFETIFENRIVGTNKVFPSATGRTYFTVAAGHAWHQSMYILTNHILAQNLIDDNSALPFIRIIHTVNEDEEYDFRSKQEIERGDVYTRFIEMLKHGGLGVKNVRPGPYSSIPGTPDMEIVVHKGIDRTQEVIFSYESGEIETADYFWSNRLNKNAAVVAGKWVEVFVADTADVQYNRRIMQVTADDLDSEFSVAPTGAQLTAVQEAMVERGRIALSSQHELALTNIEVSKETHRLAYRKDYDVGDIILVSGHYDEVSYNRIDEYVEIDDAEHGNSGYPTLTFLTDEEIARVRAKQRPKKNN